MKSWLQKRLIVVVALLTFGAISPNHEMWTNLQDKDDAKLVIGPQQSEEIDYPNGITQPLVVESLVPEATFEELFVMSAKKVSYMKFGTKIGPVIANEFDTIIFPKIEEAIQMTLISSGDLHKQRLAISEKPAGDYSEKIFNVYDLDDRKDLIRFHVRTEKRPQDGYYYNFHYHIANDKFTAHHSIGEIYWAKDTPPKWLS